MASKNDNNRQIKFLKLYMIIGYMLLIIATVATVSLLNLKKTDEALKSKVSGMTASLNMQMKMNIDSYLSSIESTGTLIFASNEAYSYDATKEDMDGYDALATEEIITNKLFDLCIMENFVDFGIVYSNNHTIGKISNGTVNLFKENIYKDLSAYINRHRTNDGWGTGYNDDYKRIYYVKQVNENAILVISFYTTELQSVFEHPGGIENIDVRLVENNNVVIYSSVESETGQPLPDMISSRIADNDHVSSTFMDDEYLITVNDCGDNWRVICSVPTYIIWQEKNEVKYYIFIVGFVAILISTLICILF
ncbi:MAG: GGDEF domain-containing protein, partial [Oscillospiraceae bacterium]